MAIKAIIDKLEDVEEAFRPLYKEKNGKWEIEVEGMKTQGDVDRLQTALTKERGDHKETKKKFDVFGDKKPDEVLAMLDRIPELELAAAGKLDDTKINELVEKRIGAKTGPLERKIKTLEQQTVEKDGKITEFTQREATRTIHDSIRDAVGKSSGFQGAALEDALLFGERHLSINEEGKVVTKDGVGVTPGIDSSVWLSEMQQRKPHWWGDTKGGGASGNKGGNANGGANPFARETWNMTEQGQLLKNNPVRAEQLAKSAGTTIGGGMPPPKK
jgi:hypothetical protein